MPTKGVVYVAFGERSQAEAQKSRETLYQFSELPVIIVSTPEPGLSDFENSRWAKTNLDNLSPFDLTLYLDADTRVRQDISAGFKIIEDGYDLALSFSEHQGADCLWHIDEEERNLTLEMCGYLPLQLQAGVMFVRKSKEIREFFENWRYEWRFFCLQDQAALLRALSYTPLKVWLLGRPWNGGAVINHNYGRCRDG